MKPIPRHPSLSHLIPLGVLSLLVRTAGAEEAAAKPKPEAQKLPEVIISAPKLDQSILSLPLSATVADREFLRSRDVRNVKEAAIYAPNTFFNQFSARKLSTPYFRGIGGSPLNPGVTTFFDGVPQFNGNSSSIEVLDVDQIDFIRGPQGALFGRNTIGGLVNITSRRPSLDKIGGGFETSIGNYNSYDFRGRFTGPLVEDKVAISLAGGYSERDGYTTNTINGNDIDNRSAWFGKAQFLWTPSKDLDVRLILAGESARDGDYALNDLASLRTNPRESQRDFQGYVNRDVVMPTLQITYHGGSVDFSSTTGFVWWKTADATDLDYSAAPLATRQNKEEMTTWTQEFRLANPAGKPLVLSDAAKLKWQAGVFLFTADYQQQANNDLDLRYSTNPILPISVPLRSDSVAGLQDWGIGTYLQGNLTLWEKLSITAGVRWDYEQKDAGLDSSNTASLLGPANASTVNADRSFSQVTPQAAIAYNITPDLFTYFSFAGGFKAGGFNPQGPTFYGEETSWNYELGIKGRALGGNLRFGVAAFYTDWDNLQLNQPLGGGQFFIANAGDATTQGIELDLNYRVCDGFTVFGSAAWQDTQFLANARDGGVSVAGNTLPFAPDYTVTAGAEFNCPLTGSLNAYARADIQFIGSFDYNAQNTIAQDAYTIANFRLGVRGKQWFTEAFVNNAFNTEYVPIAFNYQFARSGAVGESGAPLTFGVRAGVTF